MREGRVLKEGAARRGAPRGRGALARAREAVRGRGGLVGGAYERENLRGGRGDCGRGLAGRRALGGRWGEEGRGRLCGMGEGGAWFETLIFLLSAGTSRDGRGMWRPVMAEARVSPIRVLPVLKA